MNAIKDLHKSVGSAIQAIVMPTVKIFTAPLVKNKDTILSIPKQTESYGPHPRHKLDIYYSTTDPKNAPILLFFYGGGLVSGDKITPLVPGGLVYHNVGAFFAQRGINVIIPDYRRVNSERGGEDAQYPSGGEDVSLSLKWLESFEGGDKSKVFLMGNSAGGLHVSTWLLEPKFLEQRKALQGGGKAVLKGVVDLGVPFGFREAHPDRMDMLQKYYGGLEQAQELCPHGLLQAVAKTGKSRKEIGVPKELVLVSEFEPVDEVRAPSENFVKLSNEIWGDGLEFREIPGHNHISPVMSLLSGEGEQWGDDVAKWIKD